MLIAQLSISAGLSANAAPTATLTVGTMEIPHGAELVGSSHAGVDFGLHSVMESSTKRVLLSIYTGHAPNFPLKRIPEIKKIGPCIGLYTERYYSVSIDGAAHQGVEWAYLIELEDDAGPLSVHFFIPGDGSDDATVARAEGFISTLVLSPNYRCASIGR